MCCLTDGFELPVLADRRSLHRSPARCDHAGGGDRGHGGAPQRVHLPRANHLLRRCVGAPCARCAPSDILQHLLFLEKAIQREHGVILREMEELRRRLGHPQRRCTETTPVLNNSRA